MTWVDWVRVAACAWDRLFTFFKCLCRWFRLNFVFASEQVAEYISTSVLSRMLKTGDVNNFVLFLNLIEFHLWKVFYEYIMHWRQIWIRYNAYMKIFSLVRNLIMFKRIAKLFAPLCLLSILVVKHIQNSFVQCTMESYKVIKPVTIPLNKANSD